VGRGIERLPVRPLLHPTPLRNPKLIIQLLSWRQARGRGPQKGFALLAGILVVLGLIVASASLVSVVNGGLNAINDDSAANQAQAVAESGADQIIAVLNQPENRKLLVSGDVAPTTSNWTTTNANLQSPCVSTSNTRPGSNSGYPSSQAVAFADGSFRNLSNISQTGTGDRRFALKAVRYSTGSNGNTNRRSIYRTYTVGSSTAKASAGTVPTGSTFNDLVNLSDPDGSGTLMPGTNTGLIAITVEGRTYRNGNQVGSATVTKEYEVIPKCCGGSFGSNGSGGKYVTGSSLGSDSRYCGVDFGMIVGINNGKLWSYYSNDKYTQRTTTGSVVNLNNMLGIVSADGDPFSRANATIGGRTVGCRVIPGPCSTSSDVYVSGSSDQTLYGQLPATTNTNFTSLSDIAGSSASGVPIVPLYLSTGLPTVASRYAVSWTTGGRPAARIAVASNGGYPSFTSIAATKLYLRTRNDTSPPRVEFCDATYAACSSTSPVNSWAQISTAGTLTIGDDFSSNAYSGTTSNLACTAAATVQCNVNRWPTIWEENDTATGGSGVSAGNVLVGSGKATLKYVSGAPAWSTLTNRAAIARVVNLHALQSPSLSFSQTVTGLSGTAATLEVSYNTTNAAINTDTGWTQLMTTTASGGVTGTSATCTLSGSTYNCRVPIPADAQTGFTKIRLRANSAYTTAQSVAIDNVGITNSTGGAVSYDDWCEYKSTFPATSQFTGGFHCIGPTLTYSAGGTFIVDTSGGSLSWYYNDASDTRGGGVNLPASPVIFMANGATLQHVNCNPNIPPTISFTPTNDNCSTPISDSVYSVVGEQDMFNIFGRDTSPGGSGSTSMQWIQIGSFANAAGSPGKIAGAWFYMPWGAIYLIADQCGGTGGTVNFADPNGWNFGGRIWMRYIIPCGTNYFRVPPSSSTNLAGLIGMATLRTAAGDVDFVSWTGVDWVARAAVSSRSNWSL